MSVEIKRDKTRLPFLKAQSSPIIIRDFDEKAFANPRADNMRLLGNLLMLGGGFSMFTTAGIMLFAGLLHAMLPYTEAAHRVARNDAGPSAPPSNPCAGLIVNASLCINAFDSVAFYDGLTIKTLPKVEQTEKPAITLDDVWTRSGAKSLSHQPL